jgi:hypothetical protein
MRTRRPSHDRHPDSWAPRRADGLLDAEPCSVGDSACGARSPKRPARRRPGRGPGGRINCASSPDGSDAARISTLVVPATISGDGRVGQVGDEERDGEPGPASAPTPQRPDGHGLGQVSSRNLSPTMPAAKIPSGLPAISSAAPDDRAVELGVQPSRRSRPLALASPNNGRPGSWTPGAGCAPAVPGPAGRGPGGPGWR